MNQAKIEINVQPLAQLLLKTKDDFENLTAFTHYKKNEIYRCRNALISDFLNIPIHQHDFLNTEFGKPYLPSSTSCSFNHSHSQQHYALAMSKQMKDIGVDLEDLDRKVRFDALAKHAFHPNEYETWQGLDFDPLYWFKVWTTKEAILKASGLGIRMSLNELDTQVHAVNHGGIIEHEHLGIFAYQNFELARCMLTVAWRSERSCKGYAFPQILIHQH